MRRIAIRCSDSGCSTTKHMGLFPKPSNMSLMINYKAYIKRNTRNSVILKNILNSIEDIHYIDHKKEIDITSKNASILYVEDGEGDLVERCPGTSFCKCCNYFVIKNMINCPMNCSYCYLQTFSNQPYTTVHSDSDKIIESLEKASIRGKIRIGTGEYSDSFALEHITGWSEVLNEYCQNKPEIILEFKTKYAGFEPYRNKTGNIIYGVTFEPEDIIKKEQKYTSPISERINFLRKALDRNNRVALHFDPIIYTADYMERYKPLIIELSKNFKEESIAYISLGCMRFSKGLISSLMKHYPYSEILRGEYVLCPDSKYRYPREIRVSIFKDILMLIRNEYERVPVYLCMENNTVWNMVYTDFNSFSDPLFS